MSCLHHAAGPSPGANTGWVNESYYFTLLSVSAGISLGKNGASNKETEGTKEAQGPPVLGSGRGRNSGPQGDAGSHVRWSSRGDLERKVLFCFVFPGKLSIDPKGALWEGRGENLQAGSVYGDLSYCGSFGVVCLAHVATPTPPQR